MASLREAIEFSGNLFFKNAPLCATTGLDAKLTVLFACLELAQESARLAVISKTEWRMATCMENILRYFGTLKT
jgi:hypothetical protein